MSFVCPIPPMKVFVRAEYLYDHQRGHGELVEGLWVSTKSIEGRALLFETFLPIYGAVFDKLPISAFVWKKNHTEDLLPLDFLQIWDAMSYYITAVEKPLLGGLRVEFFAKDGHPYGGEYLFTLDNYHPDPRVPDFGFSKTDEHKSFNLIRLDNSQFALQPNNRCRFFDPSLSPKELLTPDFLTCTDIYSVEKHAKWRLGDTKDVTYDGRQE